MKKLATLFAIVLLCVSAGSLRADGIGTSVSGALTFSGFGSTNFFNSAYGFVPPGYGNSGGSTTTTIGSGTEFGFYDLANRDTANFTGSTLTITDNSLFGLANGYKMVFTDLAFTSFSVISNDLGLSYDFTGNTLTLNFAGGLVKGTESSVFSYTTDSLTRATAPEPGSLILLATGALGAAGAIRRKLTA